MPKKLRIWLARDQHGSTAGETDHHGMRDEIHQGAHATDAQRELKNAHLQGERQSQADILRRTGVGEIVQGRVERDRDRRGGTGNQVPGRAEQCGDDGRYHRRVEAVLGRQAGDGGEGHALRQDHHGAGETGEHILLERLAGDQRQPGKKGKEAAQRRRDSDR
jgi:hypothetical protein